MRVFSRSRDRISGLKSSGKTDFLFLLAVILLTFGLFVPFLGFYWDDWPLVYMIRSQGNWWQYYQADRPLVAWAHIITGFLLGTNRVAWHVAFLAVQTGLSLAFWWVLKLVWPKSGRAVFLTVLLFTIYPVFFQHAIAATYILPYLSYLLFLVSVGLMLLAVRKPKRMALLLGLSFLVNMPNVLALEYFWGLELLRPALLWIVFSENNPGWKLRLRKVFLTWLPSLILLGFAVYTRFVIFKLDHDPNRPTLLLGLVASPLATIKELAQIALRDLLSVLVSTWSRTVDPETISFGAMAPIASWALMFVLTSVSIWYLRNLSPEGEKESDNAATGTWARQALVLGLFSVLAGMIPAWMTGRQVITGLYGDRFALPALVGGSLFLVGLIHLVVTNWKHKVILVAILVGLAAGAQFRIEYRYWRDWNYQRQLYWQLYWRAPALQPGTTLLTEGGLLNYVTRYSLGFAVNSLYPVTPGTTNLPYWTFELDDLDGLGFPADLLIEGVPLTNTLRSFSYEAPSGDSILLSYEISKPRCLWILTTADADNPSLEPFSANALAVSNLGQILPEPIDASYPDPAVFGAEPEHTWCYYFEKADLARQFEDWAGVGALGDEARSLGFGPGDPYEWIPFVEGYLHLGDVETAAALTRTALESAPDLQASFCSAWMRAEESTTADRPVFDSAMLEFGCETP